MRVWHYTIGKYLPAIMRSGEIRLSTAFLQPGERAAAYFSTNPEWEQTANKGAEDALGNNIGMSKQETHERGGGLARIQIRPEAAPYTWDGFKRFGITAPFALSLEAIAGEVGADPSEWRISLKPVKAADWIFIEKWNGRQWDPAFF